MTTNAILNLAASIETAEPMTAQPVHQLDESRWQAILARDREQDGDAPHLACPCPADPSLRSSPAWRSLRTRTKKNGM